MPFTRRTAVHVIGRLSLAMGLVLACAGASASPAAAAPTAPSSDPFYAYSGSLAGVAPGTVLRTRQVTISAAGGAPQSYPATQVLYRTTDQLGHPDATVATIVRPAGAGVAPTKLLSYQTFYDGVASTCRPSYTLQGGDPNNTTADLDEQILLDYVQQGFTVVTSDYEGPTDDYGAGRQSAYGTLDAIRASEHLLKLGHTTPVGMLGYSGGSIASEYASELAPSYAPELKILGVAEGGIPVDYEHTVGYIDGSSSWAGAIPAVTIGLVRAYHLNVGKYFNAKGQAIFKQVEQGCLNPTAYPGLKLEDLFKPQYRAWRRVPAFIRIFNAHIMGRIGTPREPLLMGVGNADGTGDGVMIAKDVQEVAHEYCARGVPVEFHVYAQSNHDEAAPQFETQALQFLDALYGGQSVANGCASIGPGNPLTPLPPAPRAKPRRPRVVVRSVRLDRRAHGLAVVLATTRGSVGHLTVELKRGRRVVARHRLARLGTRNRRVILRVRRRAPAAGHYRLVVLVRRAMVARRSVTIRARGR